MSPQLLRQASSIFALMLSMAATLNGRGATWPAFSLYYPKTDSMSLDQLLEWIPAGGPEEVLARQVPGTGVESDVLRERSLRKYAGDYALFMSGMFRKHIEGAGSLDYYLQEGSRSYWTVSELDLALYRTGYYLYQELSTKFEYYSGALDFMGKTYFAAAPGEDPFAGFLRQIKGWMKINTSEN